MVMGEYKGVWESVTILKRSDSPQGGVKVVRNRDSLRCGAIWKELARH